MSSDNYGIGVGGLSVITKGAGQLGPENERLLLGPFRFVNHECIPNCQVSKLRCIFPTINNCLFQDNSH
jgi:hypothetical protein